MSRKRVHGRLSRPRDSRNPRGSRPSSSSCSECRAVDAGFAHRRKRRRQVALGQAAAVVMGDQRVVEIGRLGQAEQAAAAGAGSGSRGANPRRGRPVSRPKPHRRPRRRDDRRKARPCGRGWRRRNRAASLVEIACHPPPSSGQPGHRQRLGGIEPPAMRRRRPALGIVGQAAGRCRDTRLPASPCGAVSDWAISARVQKQA